MGHDAIATTEGKLPYAGFATWYRIAGKPADKPPLLALHGGPGAASGYLWTLDALADGGRQVVYYDQIGCGNSPADSRPSRWTMDFFLGELDNVIAGLGLSSYHLLGQSWGGMLAAAHAARRPDGLRGLILADTPISLPEWLAETRRLIGEMPEPHRTALLEGDRTGETATPAYAEALDAFMKKHMFRSDDAPDESDMDDLSEPYLVMWGESELRPTGTMRDADLTPLLPRIAAPTLVLHGRYDQCTDAVVRRTLDGIPDARAVRFEHSGHIPNLDEPEAFNAAVARFLDEVEATAKR